MVMLQRGKKKDMGSGREVGRERDNLRELEIIREHQRDPERSREHTEITGIPNLAECSSVGHCDVHWRQGRGLVSAFPRAQ